MKKNIITSIILAAMVIGTSSAFAADTEPIVIAPAPVAENEPMVIAPAPTAEDEPLIGVPQITVDGEKVDLSKTGLSQYIFAENGSTMVPLRAVAEKMGYAVAWDGEKQAVTVGNDTWEIVLNIGRDSYVGVTKRKDGLGMSAPQSYGTAPQIIEDTTFVPAKMFELMGYQYSTVGQFVSFEKTDTNNGLQIPNPFVSYENVDKAKKALNFEPSFPAYIPEEFILDDISVMGNDLLQLIYRDKDNDRLLFRTAKGNEDISGDYNTYANVETINMNNYEITMQGNDNLYHKACWTNSHEVFSVCSDSGIEKEIMIDIAESVN